MIATLRLEEGWFELLDQLNTFVRGHALIFLVGFIVLTLVGGLWLLAVVRRNQKLHPQRARTALMVGYGILIGSQPRPQHEEPLFPDHKSGSWDDCSD